MCGQQGLETHAKQETLASTREWEMERERVNGGDKFAWEVWRRWKRNSKCFPNPFAVRWTYLDLKTWEKRRLR
jgi:hypothetical protein